MYYRNDLPPIPILPDLAAVSNCPPFLRRDYKHATIFYINCLFSLSDSLR